MLTDVAALYSGNVVIFAGTVFVLGLAVGSFLNVVIYRLPIILEQQWREQAAELFPLVDGQAKNSAPASAVRLTLSIPRSACPVCKAPITAWQNIPVVSWLFLRGRCAACKTRISARYPIVEIATALLSASVAWHFGFGVNAACAIPLTWCLIALTCIDIDHQLLPDNLTLPLMWAGLIAAVIIGPMAGEALPVSPRDALIGAATGYISLWLVFHSFRLVTGKEGMGYGDFKLFAALGAWLGWKMLPLVIMVAASAGAVLGILMISLRGRDRAAPMPFGPYLAIAGWLAMMYGDSIVSGYLHISGLQH
jgi:leader peptidase (prepilin peptidase) / N-methyltransferase